ncbi:MAG: hypothetical protein ACJATG_001527, partial [Dinoroseobacter sp.]
ALRPSQFPTREKSDPSLGPVICSERLQQQKRHVFKKNR